MAQDITFELKTDLAPIASTVIEANFEEAKAQLIEMMKPYKKLVVSEADIRDAKGDRARIRKVKANVDDFRKTVKNIYSEPVKIFESRCKELTAICDEAALNIDKQVKAYEEKKKQEKLASLKEFFFENVGSECKEYLGFDAVLNPKWGNATYSIEDAQKEILQMITIATSSISTIRSLHSEYEAVLLDLYKSTHSLAVCLQKNDELLAIKMAEERRKAQEELRREEIRRVQAEREAEYKRRADALAAEREAAMKAANVEQAFKSAYEGGADEANNEPLYDITFRVVVNAEQMNALKQFMADHGIKPMRV